MSRHSGSDNPLANVPIFAGLGPKELEDVRGLLTEVNVEAGTTIVRQGGYATEFIIVESGTAKVERDGVLVAEVGPGDFQGEISLIGGGPRTATVTATSPMQLLVATHSEFSSLLDRAPTIARKMLPALIARMRALADQPHLH